jgi:hypothetical protein
MWRIPLVDGVRRPGFGRHWRSPARGVKEKNVSPEQRRRIWGFAAWGAIASSAAGCATTGLGWVNEPESGVDLSPPAQTTRVETGNYRTMNAALPRETYAQPRPESRPRLDHSVTLGEVTTFDARPPDPVAGTSTPTVVNVYVTPSAQPGYVGYGSGFGLGAPIFTGARTAVPIATSSTTMRPGLDWPAVPSHGPTFPYRTAPAPMWEGERTRGR